MEGQGHRLTFTFTLITCLIDTLSEKILNMVCVQGAFLSLPQCVGFGNELEILAHNLWKPLLMTLLLFHRCYSTVVNPPSESSLPRVTPCNAV